MSVTLSDIEQKLKEGVGATHVEVKDVSGGCGSSFEVLVVSSQFEGKPLLQRHRLVNRCLANELEKIHAFSQKTVTPTEWDQKK
ncbi:bolA-like protein 2 [Corticium candelabrum]|uniref:bolA-like protein 2 n=1 Tax=Corticium candelabrum TaxID=121492 RepID=UPI002E252979|nr:bolA-like protein 2 [Corticium candelabrum]